MTVKYRNYDDKYYHIVRQFLIELSQNDPKYLNWNWARWEWMMHHPDFDLNLKSNIGLWFKDDEMIGFATYDHYLGEAFIAEKNDRAELKKELLEYAVHHFSDANGLGIAVHDHDEKSIKLLESYGFRKHKNTELLLKISLNNFDFERRKHEHIDIKNIDINKDLFKHQEVLWKGFNHDGEVPSDEATWDKHRRMMSAPNLNPELHIAAQNRNNEFVAYCGCWYDPQTSYAYIEPVCTIPEYRGQGLGTTVVIEALRRCKSKGATEAYVISNDDFYKKMGFTEHSRYTFYWYNRN